MNLPSLLPLLPAHPAYARLGGAAALDPAEPARHGGGRDHTHRSRRPSFLLSVLVLSLLLLTTGCIEGLGPDPRPPGTLQPLNPTATAGPPIPTPDPARVTWSPVVGGLRLGTAVDGTLVSLGLQNVGAVPLPVLSHTTETLVELNWTTLFLKDEHGTIRQLLLGYDRDPPNAVRATLAPGAGLWQQADMAVWARRILNDAHTLRAGTYQLTAVYEVRPGANRWSGRLAVGPIPLTAPTPDPSLDSLRLLPQAALPIFRQDTSGD
ncbi:MAG: hypothetical protein M3Z04_03610 [Chloroflexota bacterium]|nr:hypothetical protein [Chloroflexota bacterium]